MYQWKWWIVWVMIVLAIFHVNSEVFRIMLTALINVNFTNDNLLLTETDWYTLGLHNPQQQCTCCCKPNMKCRCAILMSNKCALMPFRHRQQTVKTVKTLRCSTMNSERFMFWISPSSRVISKLAWADIIVTSFVTNARRFFDVVLDFVKGGARKQRVPSSLCTSEH